MENNNNPEKSTKSRNMLIFIAIFIMALVSMNYASIVYAQVQDIGTSVQGLVASTGKQYAVVIPTSRTGGYNRLFLSNQPLQAFVDGSGDIRTRGYFDLYDDYGTTYFRKTDTNINADYVMKYKNMEDAEIIWNNYNIYYEDGNIFFRRGSVMGNIIQTQTLTQANRQVLILIPLVVGLLISYLALRKALVFLKQVLQRA